LALVDQNFADRPSPEKPFSRALFPDAADPGPHSNFFDPREYQLLREDQKGHYYGVGMQVGPQPNGKTAVKVPFPGFRHTKQDCGPATSSSW